MLVARLSHFWAGKWLRGEWLRGIYFDAILNIQKRLTLNSWLSTQGHLDASLPIIFDGPVAQLVRAQSLYLCGPWFESKRAYHVKTLPISIGSVFTW